MSDKDERPTGTDEDQNHQQPPQAPQRISSTPADPYAVLNLSQTANDDEIQKAYKLLSRAFHPDKQPPGPQRDGAQEVFVEFKNAYDILTDPVLRQAYDEHGHYGVHFLRRIMNSSDDALYQTLASLHKSGLGSSAVAEARDALNEAIQYNEFQNMTRTLQTSGSVELRCTTVQSRFLGEGVEPLGLPEVEKATVSVSATAPPVGGESKWSLSVGGQCTAKNGEGSGCGQVGIGYSPVQGTDVSVDMDLGEQCKVSFGSTRMMSTRTIVTTSISTIPQSRALALSLSSHRALFENKIRGTWAMGIGSDFGVHYGLVSFTTLYDSMPKATVKLNLGVDKLPVRVTVDHNFSDDHSGSLSYGWGTMGIECKGLVTRALSKYATFGIGVRHGTDRGLSWLFQLKRRDVSLSIPITVSAVTSPGYTFKLMYLTFLSGLIQEAVGELVGDASSKIGGGKADAAALRREEDMLLLEKAREDARQQVLLMAKPADAKREAEESIDGLVILKATYWVDGGDRIDATTQLQFWVMNSSLRLPASPKSSMLGFYDVSAAVSGGTRTSAALGDDKPFFWGWWGSWRRRWANEVDPSAVVRVPQLSVRYKVGGGVYEITVRDDEPLVLPDPRATTLGRSDVVT